MCIAVPGQIIDVSNTQAKVAIMGVETTVNIQLIEDPKVGDYILIHAGCAIEKVNQAYFNELSNIFTRILYKDKRDG